MNEDKIIASTIPWTPDEVTQFRRRLGYRFDYDEEKRVVNQEYIRHNGKRFFISTVDIGIDMSITGNPPLYYETMVFPARQWDAVFCKRYSTRDEAAEGHDFFKFAITSGIMELTDGEFRLLDIIEIE